MTSTARKRATKSVPMCAVRIGYQTLIMPADAGMKLVTLLQNAFEADDRYGDGERVYFIGEQVNVEYKSVKPSQLRAKQAPGQSDLLAIGVKNDFWS